MTAHGTAAFPAVIVLAGVMLVGAQLSAQRDTAPSKGLAASDYFEIEALYARSNMAMDRGTEGGEAFARTFVPGGVLHRDGTTVTGRKNLAELLKAPPAQRTWIGNLLIEPAAEGAVGWAYVIQIPFSQAGDGASAGATATEGGLYHDIIVKTSEGWRFKTRTYRAGHGLPSAKQ